LAALGLKLGENGQLTFTSATLDSAYSSSPSAVASLLGSATDSGWLLSATSSLTNLLDPATGLVTDAETSIQAQSTSIGSQITAKNAQIAVMKKNLTAQMAAADAMIATIEQQSSFITQMLAAEKVNQQTING
jgi:flagellar hook-associated protein 2